VHVCTPQHEYQIPKICAENLVSSNALRSRDTWRQTLLGAFSLRVNFFQIHRIQAPSDHAHQRHRERTETQRQAHHLVIGQAKIFGKIFEECAASVAAKPRIVSAQRMYSLLGRAWLVHAQCVYASAAPVTDGDEIFKVDFVAVAFGAESTRFPMRFFHDFLERLMEPQGRLVCVVLLTVVDDGVVDNEIQILLNQRETHVGPFITVSLFSEGDVCVHVCVYVCEQHNV